VRGTLTGVVRVVAVGPTVTAMFRHVVLMQFTPEASVEQRQAVLDGLSSLPAAIPGIRSYVYGPDAGVMPGNHDLAVVADFDDADAYVHYANHPAHQAFIAEKVKPILAHRAAVQYAH
jgi:hypothetical protein